MYCTTATCHCKSPFTCANPSQILFLDIATLRIPIVFCPLSRSSSMAAGRASCSAGFLLYIFGYPSSVTLQYFFLNYLRIFNLFLLVNFFSYIVRTLNMKSTVVIDFCFLRQDLTREPRLAWNWRSLPLPPGAGSQVRASLLSAVDELFVSWQICRYCEAWI